MNNPPLNPATAAALRRRAETALRQQQAKAAPRKKAAGDTQRLLHELRVHQIELEMQNAELLESRDQMEAQMDKFSDLYDFAPVSYFSLDEQGVILEVNLTGATLLGVERSRLMNRRLQSFVAPSSVPNFLKFLESVFSKPGKNVTETSIRMEDGVVFWADIQAVMAITLTGQQRCCRMAVSDITPLKRADEAQRRMEALALSNLKMEKEIARRAVVERSLKKGEEHQLRMLEQAYQMQRQLRELTHEMLHTQEEERKRISRELHDEIAQILVGINVQLVTLTKESAGCSKALAEKIARTQQLVEESVAVVQRFARDLRPTMLDELGLIPALETYLHDYMGRTGIRVSFTAFAGANKLNIDGRTILYRVALEALTNVARHSKADHATVRIHQQKGVVRMEVHDNGIGFHAAAVPLAKGRKRLGLLGMNERVEMVGGTCSIESAPGQKTTVSVALPLKRVVEKTAVKKKQAPVKKSRGGRGKRSSK
jgi:PAS domain S-box-containing protein